MTPHQRLRYWKKFAQQQTAIENAFLPRMESAIASQFSALVDYAKTYGFDEARNRISVIVQGDKVHQALGKLYQIAGKEYASITYGRLKEEQTKFRGFGFNEQWTEIINQYLGNYNLLNVVNGITDTTKERILKVISKGIEDGLGVDEIVNKLKSDEYTTARARLIVRTESVGAMNMGGMIGAMSTGIMYQKEWISALDHRVRGLKPKDQFSHIGLNGDVVDMEKGFNNGEPILYPGDKNASPGNICNCRCTMNYIAKRDANGRIMTYTDLPEGQLLQPSRNDAMSGVLLQMIIGTVLGRVLENVYSD